MVAVQVRQYDRRYRYAASQAHLKSRVDALTESLLDGYLEPALERRGIRSGHELCIRQLEFDLSYPSGQTDGACLVDWSDRLAEAIADALDRGDASRVVRYRSRVHASVDVVRSLLANRLERYWAWNALGITRHSSYPTPAETAQQWLASLCVDPDIVAVMRTLIDARLVPGLLDRSPLTLADLDRIARAALARVGRRGPSNRGEPGDADSGPARLASAPASLHPAATRVARRATLGAELAGRMTRHLSPLPALMVWPLVELEPGLLARPQDELEQILSDLDRIVCDGPPRSAASPETAPATGFRTGAADGPARTATAPDPDSVRRVMGAGVGGTAANPTPPDRTTRQEPALRVPLSDAAPGSEPVADPGIGPHASAPAAVVRSNCGGLLLLINLMARLDLVGALYADPVTLPRPLGWLLEHLAMRLLPLPGADPALAVFSNRRLDEPPWCEREPPISAPEDALVTTAAEALAAAVQDLLPEIAPGEAVPKLVQRRARLEISPGWVTAFFALESATTDIRRAGLDLHPDYVPWLGTIVRFEYE